MELERRIHILGYAIIPLVLAAMLSLSAFDLVRAAEVIEAVTLAVLVAVTAAHVKISRDSADSAQQQVKASLEMIREARSQAEASHELARRAQEQLQSGVMPILRFKHAVGLRPADLEVENIGFGPATNLKAWVEVRTPSGGLSRWTTSSESRAFESQVLPAGRGLREMGEGRWTCIPGPEPGDTHSVSYKVIYQDIHDNSFKSEVNAVNVTGELRTERYSVDRLTEDEVRHLLDEIGYTSPTVRSIGGG